MHLRAHVCAYTYIHVNTYMHACMYAHTHKHMHLNTWYAARLNCMENAVYKLLDHACIPTLVSLPTYLRTHAHTHAHTHTRTHAHAHTLVRATWALAQGTTGRQGWIRFDMHLWLLAADCAAGKCRHGAGAGGAARPLPRQVCSSSHQ